MKSSQSPVLTIRSTDELKRDFNVSINSIRKRVSSANYVDWDYMNKEETEKLINEVIKGGYILNFDSPSVLKNNIEVVLSSLKRKPDSVDFIAKTKLYNNLEIDRKCYRGLSKNVLEIRPVANYADKEMINYVLKKLTIDNERKFLKEYFQDNKEEMNKYFDRISELYVDALNKAPSIKNFKEVLEECAELQWDSYRMENMSLFANVFRKITDELQNNKRYEAVEEKLFFLNYMKKELNDKYSQLINVMKEYHQIYHKKVNDNIESSRNTIADLTSLYISLSKENYKKKKITKDFINIRKMFIPKINNPLVYKKLTEYKQINNFRDLYKDNDKIVCDFINDICDKYSNIIDNSVIKTMLEKYLWHNESKLNTFREPCGWYDYKRYKEATKLVNRLNKGYIKYTDQELNRYLDIIKFDKEKNCFYYDGSSFDEYEINVYNAYFKELYVFNEIKKEIVLKSKEICPNIEITNEDLRAISHELPFNDEFFEFDREYASNMFTLDDFISCCTKKKGIISKKSIINDEAYSLLREYVLNNDLIWLMLALREYKISLKETGLEKDSLLSTFDYMNNVCKLAKSLDYGFGRFKETLLLIQIVSCADEKTIAILGKDLILKLTKNKSYTKINSKEVVNIARELVSKMCIRNNSTVPYINGSLHGYNYSIYDSQDNEVLLSGINTDSCFRIGSYDNDFLHYCALDKNGFVIKITNDFGEFIGRAAGFRNGNTVFINQLRTVYDSGGEGYKGKNKDEHDKIVEAFCQACGDFVKYSIVNPSDKLKINYVFVTQSYSLKHSKSNVSWILTKKIGKKPMDTKSEDWEYFTEHTNNLKEVHENGFFPTDYGTYKLICVATNEEGATENKLSGNIIKKDVPAIYQRKRNPIIVTDILNKDLITKINKIRGIYAYLNNENYSDLPISIGTKYFIGDNWYIAYYPDKSIDGVVLNDKKAIIEYEATMKTIGEEFNNKVLVKKE